MIDSAYISVHVVLQNGHAVSPLLRVLTRSGDWIWMTTEVTLRCKSGTIMPQFIEFKGRVLRYALAWHGTVYPVVDLSLYMYMYVIIYSILFHMYIHYT